MKIDFSTPLLNLLTGKPFTTKDGEKERPMLLSDAAIEALMALNPQAQDTGEQKLKCYQLAQKVQLGGEVELDPEDVALIKSKVGAIYGPAIVGPAFTLLNG